MSGLDREHLVDNIVGHLGHEVSDEVTARAVQYLRNVDDELGGRVASGLGWPLADLVEPADEVERPAA